MSNKEMNSNNLGTESNQNEQGAQVLPFRRQLKSLNSTLQRPKKAKSFRINRTPTQTPSPLRSKGVVVLQTVLLAVALILTLKNCGTI
jgi:hypothetical protein